MPKVHIVQQAEFPAQQEYAALGCQATGVVTSKMATPTEYPLWLCLSTLQAGAEISWLGDHEDQAVFVISGKLEAAGRECPAGGAIIVENDVAATVRAVEESYVAHFGDRDNRRVPGKQGKGIHVNGPRGIYSTHNPEGAAAYFFGDSKCPNCDISMFYSNYLPPSGRHSHSQDEIIYLVEGSISMGQRPAAPGTSLCIPGDIRYILQPGAAPFAYLNYRPTDSTGIRYDEHGQVRPSNGRSDARSQGQVRENDSVFVEMAAAR